MKKKQQSEKKGRFLSEYSQISETENNQKTRKCDLSLN
jgi:hypothetical protein